MSLIILIMESLVELENITTEEDYLNKLRTGYSGGDTPNVFTEYGGARVKDYIAANGVLIGQTIFGGRQRILR